jgi:ABC-type polar amino acid transport system ATPase subunit
VAPLLYPTEHVLPMIEVRNVAKSYGDFRALDGCSASVAKGSVVVVCGPSGSGKSTLIRCINGLERIDSGEITVDGVAVHAPETDRTRFARASEWSSKASSCSRTGPFSRTSTSRR